MKEEVKGDIEMKEAPIIDESMTSNKIVPVTAEMITPAKVSTILK